MKFLNALQEDTGNNFSYLVPMKIVNSEGGDNLPLGKVAPPPLNPHVCFHFYVMIKEPGYLKFLNALQEDTGNSFSYLVPMNIVNRSEGGQSTLG